MQQCDSSITRAVRARLLAAVSLAVGLAALPPAPVHADDLARGRDMATRLCAACHMNPDQGEKLGPMDIPGFAAIARRKDQTIDGVVDWLRSTPPMMPNHHLTQDEMYALAVFILSLRDEPAPAAPRTRR